MLSDKSFRAALIISFMAHSMLFYQPISSKIIPAKKPLNQLEVTYYSSKNLPKPTPIETKEHKIIMVKVDKLKTDILSRKEAIKKGKDPFKNEVVIKPQPSREDVFIQNVASVSQETALNKEPLYIGYYQIVREKIRQAATHNYERHSDTGEIHVFFMLNSEGLLKNLSVNKENSSGIKFLQDVALKSIKDASPFPRFPEELNRDQLSFNVIISFERSFF